MNCGREDCWSCNPPEDKGYCSYHDYWYDLYDGCHWCEDEFKEVEDESE